MAAADVIAKRPGQRATGARAPRNRRTIGGLPMRASAKARFSKSI
jgi:hypothetical protein